MMTTRTRAVVLAFGLTVLTAPATFATVAFDWVTIGNADNDADPTTHLGAVGSPFLLRRCRD
jgi:hypothetical protein